VVNGPPLKPSAIALAIGQWNEDVAAEERAALHCNHQAWEQWPLCRSHQTDCGASTCSGCGITVRCTCIRVATLRWRCLSAVSCASDARLSQCGDVCTNFCRCIESKIVESWEFIPRPVSLYSYSIADMMDTLRRNSVLLAALDAEALFEDLLHQYADSFIWHAQPEARVGQIGSDVPIPTCQSLSEEHLSQLPFDSIELSTLMPPNIPSLQSTHTPAVVPDEGLTELLSDLQGVQEVEVDVEDGSHNDEEEDLSSSHNEPTPLDQWWWLEGANAPQHVTSMAERAFLLNNAQTYRCRTTCFGSGAEAHLRAHATTVRSRRFRGRDARVDRSDDLTYDEEDEHRQERFAEYYTIPGHPRPIAITTKAQKLFLKDECANLPPDVRCHTFQSRGFFYHGRGPPAVEDALETTQRFDEHGHLATGSRNPAHTAGPSSVHRRSSVAFL